MTSRDVEVLVEYEHRQLNLTAGQVRDLIAVAGPRILVTPSAEDGSWRVQAKQFVGSIVTPGMELLIRPKASLENLFLLLGIGLPPRAWADETFAFETSRELLPAFAAFFGRTVERTLATGLLHSYDLRHERVPAIRGRIDFAQQVRHPELAFPLACQFDEFTSDIEHNRILKAAIRLLMRLTGVQPEARRVLMRELSQFEEVSDTLPQSSAVDRLVFTRLDSHYEPALRLAALVLSSTSLIDRPGDRDASSFLIDMNDLFQRFVTQELTRRLVGSLRVEAEPAHWLGQRRMLQMRPDLVFREQERLAYVADVKYKLTTTGRAVNPDYYQLLAYTTVLDLPEGLLIYSQREGDVPETVVQVRHSGQLLHTYPIDLTGGTKQVDRALDRLADWIREHARATRTEIHLTSA